MQLPQWSQSRRPLKKLVGSWWSPLPRAPSTFCPTTSRQTLTHFMHCTHLLEFFMMTGLNW